MTPYLCVVCNGTGKVASDFYPEVLPNPEIKFVVCRSCNGTGILWSKTQQEKIEDNEFIISNMPIRKSRVAPTQTKQEEARLTGILNQIKTTAENKINNEKNIKDKTLET